MELSNKSDLYHDLVLPKIREVESEAGLSEGALSTGADYLKQVVLNSLTPAQARLLNELIYDRTIKAPFEQKLSLAEIDGLQILTQEDIPDHVYSSLKALVSGLCEMMEKNFLFGGDQVDFSCRARDIMKDHYFNDPMETISSLILKNKLSAKFRETIFQVASLGASEEELTRYYDDFISVELKEFLRTLPQPKNWTWLHHLALLEGYFDEKLLKAYLK